MSAFVDPRFIPKGFKCEASLQSLQSRVKNNPVPSRLLLEWLKSDKEIPSILGKLMRPAVPPLRSTQEANSGGPFSFLGRSFSEKQKSTTAKPSLTLDYQTALQFISNMTESILSPIFGRTPETQMNQQQQRNSSSLTQQSYPFVQTVQETLLQFFQPQSQSKISSIPMDCPSGFTLLPSYREELRFRNKESHSSSFDNNAILFRLPGIAVDIISDMIAAIGYDSTIETNQTDDYNEQPLQPLSHIQKISQGKFLYNKRMYNSIMESLCFIITWYTYSLLQMHI